MSARNWFITGCSRGFGLALAKAVLDHGDRVVASARRAADVRAALGHADDVLVLELDVTRDDQIDAGVAEALARFGHVDILVNNAGHGLIGAIEETSTAEARAIFDVNVIGLIAVTRAILPSMRQRRSGHIINVSSAGGYTGSPGWGVYGATKWAVEGLTESMAMELAEFGIKVTSVALDSYGTDFMVAARRAEAEIGAYAQTAGTARAMAEKPGAYGQKAIGPAAEVVYRLSLETEPPLNLPVGQFALGIGRTAATRFGSDLDRWASLSAAAG
jgi:NAD(P)-dependent dehydrogenase (short-subunit alcohol dehydrogenase family)